MAADETPAQPDAMRCDVCGSTEPHDARAAAEAGRADEDDGYGPHVIRHDGVVYETAERWASSDPPYLDAALAIEGEDEAAVRLSQLPGFRALVDRAETVTRQLREAMVIADSAIDYVTGGVGGGQLATRWAALVKAVKARTSDGSGT